MEIQPASFTRRWPDPAAGPFSLRVWIGYPRGAPEIVGVEMWGVEPIQLAWRFDEEPGPREAREDLPALADTPVKAEDIRIRLGELLSAWISLHGNLAESQPDTPQRRAFLRGLQVQPKRRRSGPRDLRPSDPGFLQEVARVYRSAVEAGDRRPNKAVQEWAATVGKHASAPTARSWVHMAHGCGASATDHPGKDQDQGGIVKGSIRQRGKTWTAYWFTVDPGDGQRRQHSKGGFRTKGAAQEHLNEVLGKVQTGAWAPDKRITVGELLTEWLAAKRSQGLRATTLSQYQNVVDSWLVPHVGAVQLAKMSPSQAQQLVEVLRVRGGRNCTPLSARSVQLSVVVLKASTAWAFETGLVGRDHLAGFRRPRAAVGNGAGKAWTAEEARAFLVSVTDDRLVAAWTLLLTRGLRRGELAGLRWDAVDLEGGTLRIVRTRVLVDGKPVDSEPKTDAGRRTIPLDPSLVSCFRSHWVQQGTERLAAGEAWNDQGYVFTDQLGLPLYPDLFSERFIALAEAAGLRRIRLHDLRHSAASLMLASGENVKVVAELLGHASPTITQNIYQHVLPGMSHTAGKRLSIALRGSTGT